MHELPASLLIDYSAQECLDNPGCFEHYAGPMFKMLGKLDSGPQTPVRPAALPHPRGLAGETVSPKSLSEGSRGSFAIIHRLAPARFGNHPAQQFLPTRRPAQSEVLPESNPVQPQEVSVRLGSRNQIKGILEAEEQSHERHDIFQMVREYRKEAGRITGPQESKIAIRDFKAGNIIDP